ncbi:CoA transferase [Novosphingobium sp. BL-52-GroH]|uniref:CoA transferase n=1 Tax=Novosphingobium sp. BL-52-GroH TaxID=3349877 RepID=UPI00384B204D
MIIVDLLEPSVSSTTSIYTQLGARVIRIQAGSVPSDPRDSRAALAEFVADLGKEQVQIEVETYAGGEHLRRLAAQADLILASYPATPAVQTILDVLAEHLSEKAVWMTVSMFGQGNSYSGWQATDPVLNALSSELSRSGLAGREPLLPPGKLAFNCAMSQAAYVGMAALYAAQVTGHGDRIDFSMLDGAVQGLDPGFGLAGSATLGRSARNLPPGRPEPGTLYPIFPCADGHVRLCVLAPRQWQNMHRWLGSPAEFSAPEFNRIDVRQSSAELSRYLKAFFAARSWEDLEREGAQQGVPISGVLSLQECLATDHVRARGIIATVALPDGRTVRMPRGVIAIDHGIDGGGNTPAASPRLKEATPSQPLAGLKVLDLGVIVVGGEQSRLLADLGADVVKIESASFPDGTRHTYLPTGLSVGFAAGHRNKRSLGLDLRHPEGKAIFLRLAGEADVILSNFKPGTMESLGFDYETIRQINPGIVMVDSSAFGADGPWAGRMGYGPLVRAASGLTSKWCYPDDAQAYSDAVTIYPDHAAARYGIIAVLALLYRRLRTHHGGTASLSQMEVMLDHFAAEIAALDLDVGDWDVPGDAPWGVYQTQGDDEWCVVTVRGDNDWQALANVMAPDGPTWSAAFGDFHARLQHRDVIDERLRAWMLSHTADEAMRKLQAAGVPAARMLRIADLPEFGYYTERGLLRVEEHPHLAEEVIAESFHAMSENLGQLPSTPAPLMGEHSIDVVRDWLGLSQGEIEQLIGANVLQGVAPDIESMLARGEGRGAELVA